MYRECMDCFTQDDEARFLDSAESCFVCPVCGSRWTLGVSEHPELRGEVE